MSLRRACRRTPRAKRNRPPMHPGSIGAPFAGGGKQRSTFIEAVDQARPWVFTDFDWIQNKMCLTVRFFGAYKPSIRRKRLLRLRVPGLSENACWGRGEEINRKMRVRWSLLWSVAFLAASLTLAGAANAQF